MKREKCKRFVIFTSSGKQLEGGGQHICGSAKSYGDWRKEV